jgi:hypothetical protein
VFPGLEKEYVVTDQRPASTEEFMTIDNAKKTASQCRHYAMCKIDYLGTGLCPSDPKKHYVAYYPQGRMDFYDALTSGLIPVTEALLDIADACILCGICDKQCHFVTGLRPVEVMRALKERVAEHRKNGGAVFRRFSSGEGRGSRPSPKNRGGELGGQ